MRNKWEFIKSYKWPLIVTVLLGLVVAFGTCAVRAGINDGPDGFGLVMLLRNGACAEDSGVIGIIEGRYPTYNELRSLGECEYVEFRFDVDTTKWDLVDFTEDLDRLYPTSACDDTLDCSLAIINGCAKHGGVMSTRFDRTSANPCEGTCNDNKVVRAVCKEIKVPAPTPPDPGPGVTTITDDVIPYRN